MKMENHELTQQRCGYWAKLPNWGFTKARRLVAGIDPDKSWEYPFGLDEATDEAFFMEVERHKGKNFLLSMMEDRQEWTPKKWLEFCDEIDVPVHAPLRDAILNQTADRGSDIDPADWPDELFAAMTAFRAVTNGYGNSSDTFKNRLTEFLASNFKHLSKEAIGRISTVANIDKSRGRPRSDDK